MVTGRYRFMRKPSKFAVGKPTRSPWPTRSDISETSIEKQPDESWPNPVTTKLLLFIGVTNKLPFSIWQTLSDPWRYSKTTQANLKKRDNYGRKRKIYILLSMYPRVLPNAPGGWPF